MSEPTKSTISESETTKMIILESSDKQIISVEESVALQSQTLKNMIEDDCINPPIPIPKVTGKTLTKIMDYCKIHAANDGDGDGDGEALRAFDEEFVNVDQAELYALIMAADFLGIRSLVELSCNTVADLIREIKKMESDPSYNINVTGDIKQMLKELGTEKRKELARHGGGGNKAQNERAAALTAILAARSRIKEDKNVEAKTQPFSIVDAASASVHGRSAAAAKATSSDKTAARIAMHMAGDRTPVNAKLMGLEGEGEKGCNGDEDGEEGVCEADYSDDEDEVDTTFDRETFSKLLKRVSWSDTKLFSQLAFLSNMAYVIPEIKPEDLRRYYDLEFVTSSLEKKALAEAITAELNKDLVQAFHS